MIIFRSNAKVSGVHNVGEVVNPCEQFGVFLIDGRVLNGVHINACIINGCVPNAQGFFWHGWSAFVDGRIAALVCVVAEGGEFRIPILHG